MLLYYTHGKLYLSHFTEYDILLNGKRILKGIMEKIEGDCIINISELSLVLYVFQTIKKTTKRQKTKETGSETYIHGTLKPNHHQSIHSNQQHSINIETQQSTDGILSSKRSMDNEESIDNEDSIENEESIDQQPQNHNISLISNPQIIKYSNDVSEEIKQLHKKKKCSENMCDRSYHSGKKWILSLNPDIDKRLCDVHNKMKYQKKHFNQII